MRATRSRPVPYTTLTTVRSETGSWSYEIRISHKTGVTYCTCRGWAFHKTCRHLDAYRQHPTFAAVPVAVEDVAEAHAPAARRRSGRIRPAGHSRTSGALAERLREALIQSSYDVPIDVCRRIVEQLAIATSGPALVPTADVGLNTSARVIILPD